MAVYDPRLSRQSMSESVPEHIDRNFFLQSPDLMQLLPSRWSCPVLHGLIGRHADHPAPDLWLLSDHRSQLRNLPIQVASASRQHSATSLILQISDATRRIAIKDDTVAV